MENIIIKQVDYLRGPNKEATARNIIRTKIENCRYLLTRFRNTRKNSAIGKQIFFHQNMLNRHVSSLKNNPIELEHLMLIEARAGKHYWEASRVICKQDSAWCRVYPHAKDSLNTALNIGYMFLGRFCKETLEKNELQLSLGMIHSPNHKNSLAYDFMEVWRQAVVDAIIIPLFSRGNNAAKPGTIIFKMQGGLETQYRYKTEMITLGRIIGYEAYELRKAIEQGKAWKPFRMLWGNSRRMKKPTQKSRQENIFGSDERPNLEVSPPSSKRSTSVPHLLLN